jgi:precorrin-6Y C5,15-methyltransferase (decarboxylating)
VERAEVLMGSGRQLELVPPSVTAERVPWPSPMTEALPGLFETHGDRAVVVLASGDPMLSGIGTTLTRLLGAERVRVLPAPSSVSLACARLGWAVEDTQVVSLVGRPIELLHPHVQPGRRLLVLGSDGDTPKQVAALLSARGYGQSLITVLGGLGGPDEEVRTGTAATWSQPAPALVVTAVECRAERGTMPLPTTPGLPDGAYESDGQLTKSEVRAITLARLAALPGQMLWDIGAGSGSIGIEWMRAHPTCRAVAVEASAERAERIVRNASRLGVPYLRVVHGHAPDVLPRLPQPDAVFIGGGVTTPLLLDACWDALPVGGRLVVNAVTVESEAVLGSWHARVGGELVRVSVQRAEPLGGFTGWKPAMPVTIWSVTR